VQLFAFYRQYIVLPLHLNVDQRPLAAAEEKVLNA
jgi:hypothetical protein